MTVYPDNTNGGLAGNEETQGLHGVNLPAGVACSIPGRLTSPPTAHQFIDPANANPQNPGFSHIDGRGRLYCARTEQHRGYGGGWLDRHVWLRRAAPPSPGIIGQIVGTL